ncbi:MAG: hypothetical protein F4X59_10125 [Holophagales bacterium]|nr:hypothetical protein [Holophagales bacterium]MYC10473.1 hypothetical protein [Holophagales bacterium]
MGLGGSFGLADWLILLALFAAITVMVRSLSRRQKTERDYFGGARNLPWYAVAASLVATEISAVTYISLPSIVHRPGGDLTYLQIGLFGYLAARLLVAWLLVPAYYRYDVMSPYDLIERRLGTAGASVRRTATGMFWLGGVLAQSARVYLSAVVLGVLLHRELGWLERTTGVPPHVAAVAAVVVIAVVWTWLGGIVAVVWTDVVLFLLFVAGVAVSLGVVAWELEAGMAPALAAAWSEGKFTLFDLSASLVAPYTLWAALIGATIGGVAAFGTDQLMAQRLFCCRSARDAQLAVMASGASVLVSLSFAFVGIGLWAYYEQAPLTGVAAEIVAEQPDRIFAVFAVEAVAVGLKALVVAGALAAAVSSLDSILAALAQTTSALLRSRARPGNGVRLPRLLVLGWGFVLGLTSLAMDTVAARYDALLDLALAMAGYTGGALLAAVALALAPLGRDGRGFLWSGPLSALAVFAAVWHQPAAGWVCLLGVIVLLWTWLRRDGRGRRGASLLLLVGATLVMALWRWAEGPGGEVLAWPWYVPLGAAVAWLWGLGLSRRVPASVEG